MKKQFITHFQLHLIELKHNFIVYIFLYIYLFFISYYFSDQLIYLFTKKLIQSNLLKYFIFTNITEKVLTNIFISFIISIFISLQLLFLQMWFFTSKGLYKYENLKIFKYFVLIFIFNFFIIKFILINIIPNIWFFFVNFNFSNTYLFNIYFEPKFNNYFHFYFFSFTYIYLLFYYFFFFLFLLFKKIFKVENIINLRKFFYFKFIVFSILISPPEILNQIIIITLFLLFFEISIFIYLIFYKYFKY